MCSLQRLLGSFLALGALSTLQTAAAQATLTGDVLSIDLNTGGVHNLTLSDPSSPNKFYLLGGTDTGTSPGFDLLGFPVPLNATGSYWDLTMGLGFPQLAPAVGMLDGSGQASAALTVPNGLPLHIAGEVYNHAFVVMDFMPLAVLSVSNPVPVVMLDGPLTLVINELDYDQPGTDTDEFVEIYNPGPSSIDLENMVLELISGSDDTVYDTIPLIQAASSLPADSYIVVGTATLNATLPPGTLSIDFANTSDEVQDGPDGARLVIGDIVVDSLSYAGVMSATEGVGGAGTDDSGIAMAGLSRLPNGSDTDDNAADFGFVPTTPGDANAAPVPELVINEVDYNQPSSDLDEFIEITNTGIFAADLSLVTLELVNGSLEVIYDTIALSDGAATLASGEFLVVGSTTLIATLPAGTPSIDNGITNLIQNGAPDGAQLVLADPSSSSSSILDSFSYEGDMSTTEGVGGAGIDDGVNAAEGLSRIPDGTDTDDNAADFEFVPTTPGQANVSGGPVSMLVINEVDYDQPGTDADEFVEIYNPGATEADLTNVVLEFVNGSGDVVYETFSLSAAGATLPAGEYLVVGSSSVIAGLPMGTLAVDLGSASIQNGDPDGLRLLDTGVVTDMMSYGGDMSTTEGTGGAGTDNGGNADEGLSRTPNGTDTDDNAEDFELTVSTPGAANVEGG